MTLDELQTAYEAGEIDTVLVAAPDMQGRLVGKRTHAAHFLHTGYQETHCCNYLLATDMEMQTVEGYAATSWAKGYGDYVMKPELSTLRPIPWLPHTALVLCDLIDHHTHEEVAISPRAILKRQVARAREMGYVPMAATELEFFIFEQSYETLRDEGAESLTPISSYNEDYHLFQTSKEEPLMRTLRNGLYGAGIPVESTKGEAEAGQEEINIRYADMLTTADFHVITKQAAKEIAYSLGKSVTFMAKYHDQRAGSSSHVHQSLFTSDGEPAFLDKTAEYGMSEVMRQFMAGQLVYAGEITALLAPNVNSYKRFCTGMFAPTKAVWSLDNRTAGFRVCGDGTKAVRIECRIGGADLNPYLACAGLLAAGLAGIEQKMILEAETRGDTYRDNQAREIPKNLRDATDRLERSEMLRSAFGDEVVEHYTRAARWEIEEQDRVVTNWERTRLLERG